MLVLTSALRVLATLQTANDALAQEKERMDVLLARQHNLISCVLQGDLNGNASGKQSSAQHRTLGEPRARSKQPVAHIQHLMYGVYAPCIVFGLPGSTGESVLGLERWTRGQNPPKS
jgi:hypothetical protein